MQKLSTQTARRGGKKNANKEDFNVNKPDILQRGILSNIIRVTVYDPCTHISSIPCLYVLPLHFVLACPSDLASPLVGPTAPAALLSAGTLLHWRPAPRSLFLPTG